MKKLKIALRLNKVVNALLIITIIFSLIFTLVIEHSSIYNINDKEFKCTITDKKFDGNKLSLKLKCDEKLVATYYIKSLEEKEYLEKTIEYGDFFYLNGELNVPSNNTVPYLFNYKKYLYNNQIYYTLNINELKLIRKSNNTLYKIKNFAYKRAKILDNNYIYAFILGNTSSIENDVLKAHRNNGISHLLALSGLHVSVFSLILNTILKRLRIKENKRAIIIFILLMIFSFISGFSISLLRASLFFLFLSLNKQLKLEISTLNILKYTFIILLLVNPYNLFNVSFILSFITTFFLVLNNKKETNYIKGLFKMSIISYFASFGISIYYFGVTNFLSPLFNLFFVPLVSFIIFPLSLLTFIFPFLRSILNMFLCLFENVSFFLDRYSLKIYFPYLNPIYIYFYYIMLYIYIKYKKRVTLIFILILIIFLKLKPYLDYNTYVYFLDVGQGDSSVMVSPHLKNVILIDTGGKITFQNDEWKQAKNNYSIAKDTLIPFLRKIGVNKIKFLILSHGDYDHMGEAINLVENFKVDKVIFNCGEFNDLEKELIKVLDKKKIKYYSCIKELDVDKNKLYFLQTKEYDNENDNSNVIYTEFNGYKFMFMGDASSTTEKEILNKYNLPNIDVLKVGHHGSKTSSRKKFVDEIKPTYSIISVGKNNRYGHPNKEVLENLENSKIYRTDKQGSIVFKIKNHKLKVETYSP